MNILFVCTGNTCRSPLAQAIMQKYCDEKGLDVQSDSAGLECGYGGEVSQNSMQIINERQILFTHQSQPVTQRLIDNSDMVIAMTQMHKQILKPYVPEEKLYSMSDFIGCDIYDPYGQSIEVYRKCAEQIDKAVKEIAKKISAEKK